MLKLSFSKPPYTIFKESFEIELPDFTIITGLNGAGKTQLLYALKDKQVQVIADDGTFLDVSSIYRYEKDDRHNSDEKLQAGGYSSYQKGEDVRNAIRRIFEPYERLKLNAERSNQSIQDFLTPEHNIHNRDYVLIMEIAQKSDKNIDNLILDDFIQHIPMSFAYSHYFTRHSFGDLFLLYAYKWYHNQSIRLSHQGGQKKGIKCYTDQGFIDNFGEPPWELVKQILEEGGLGYTVNSPDMDITDDMDKRFYLEFKDKNNNVINLENLSSGEKVLMALTFARYNSDIGAGDFPKIILMDEPDAPLHPSMTKQFLDIVQNVFVKKKNMKVIMTTHSPSTVAIAKKESLYVMEKIGTKRNLRKVQKDDAIKELTKDIPFLSVDYQKTRFVVVEGKTDMLFYPEIYKKLRFQDYLNDSINLIFMHSGSLHDGANSYAVQKVVKAFNENSNKDKSTHYGIIDWDKDDSPKEDNIKILGKGKRYSLENYIFDPLYLALFWMEFNYISKEDLNISATENLGDNNFDNSRLQSIADIVINKLDFANGDKQNTTYVPITYINGKVINIPKWYLEYNWHKDNDAMIRKIKDNLYKSIQYQRTLAELKEDIITTVINKAPQLIPNDILELFKTLH